MAAPSPKCSLSYEDTLDMVSPVRTHTFHFLPASKKEKEPLLRKRAFFLRKNKKIKKNSQVFWQLSNQKSKLESPMLLQW